MTILPEMLSQIAIEFVKQRTKSFAQNDFGNFVRHDVAIEAKKAPFVPTIRVDGKSKCRLRELGSSALVGVF